MKAPHAGPRGNRAGAAAWAALVASCAATGQVASAAAWPDFVDSALLDSPAQLHRISTSQLAASATALRESQTPAAAQQERVAFATKATPSLYWGVAGQRAQLGRQQATQLAPTAAFKILDKFVLGLGGSWRGGSSEIGGVSEGFLVKGERYEVGTSSLQERLFHAGPAASSEAPAAHGYSLHARGLLAPDLALSVSRDYRRFDASSPAVGSSLELYRIGAEARLGAVKTELAFTSNTVGTLSGLGGLTTAGGFAKRDQLRLAAYWLGSADWGLELNTIYGWQTGSSASGFGLGALALW